MRISEQNRADAISVIKWSKLNLFIMPIAAGILAIWSPFYPKFFATAVALGILAASITWFGWTRKTHSQIFQILRLVIPTIGLLMSRDLLLPGTLSHWSYRIAWMQSFAVMFFAYAATILLMCIWFKKELSNIFAPTQPPSLPG